MEFTCSTRSAALIAARAAWRAPRRRRGILASRVDAGMRQRELDKPLTQRVSCRAPLDFARGQAQQQKRGEPGALGEAAEAHPLALGVDVAADHAEVVHVG